MGRSCPPAFWRLPISPVRRRRSSCSGGTPSWASRPRSPPTGYLNVGAIVVLSPVLPAAVKAVFNSWGPGKYDAEFNRDGINSPVVIPPALGLRNVALETYTAEGPVSYWHNYVAVTQMDGHGSFSAPALGVDIQ